MYNCILCIFRKGLIDNMGIFGSRDKRRQNDEDDESLLRRKEKRRQRIEKRIEEKKLREELVQNTMVTKKSFSGNKKDPFEEEKIIDRNNERKKKRGEKVKFKDLSTGKKILRIFKWILITMITLRNISTCSRNSCSILLLK